MAKDLFIFICCMASAAILGIMCVNYSEAKKASDCKLYFYDCEQVGICKVPGYCVKG